MLNFFGFDFFVLKLKTEFFFKFRTLVQTLYKLKFKIQTYELYKLYIVRKMQNIQNSLIELLL